MNEEEEATALATMRAVIEADKELTAIAALETKITTLEARIPPGVMVTPAPSRFMETTFADGSWEVKDLDGVTRVRFGVWGETQEIPADNDSTQQALTMDFNNTDILKQRLFRDKAIIAMHVLRVTKPQGDKGKGIGPNREDHPLFREVVHMWMQGAEITGENLDKVEQARERVTKYAKQLRNSIYLGPITNPDYKRAEMLESVQHAYKEQAEAELAQALREETYGGW